MIGNTNHDEVEASQITIESNINWYQETIDLNAQTDELTNRYLKIMEKVLSPELESDEDYDDEQDPYPFWYEYKDGWKYIRSYDEEMRADNDSQTRVGVEVELRYIAEVEADSILKSSRISKDWSGYYCGICEERHLTLYTASDHIKTNSHKRQLKNYEI